MRSVPETDQGKTKLMGETVVASHVHALRRACRLRLQPVLASRGGIGRQHDRTRVRHEARLLRCARRQREGICAGVGIHGWRRNLDGRPASEQLQGPHCRGRGIHGAAELQRCRRGVRGHDRDQAAVDLGDRAVARRHAGHHRGHAVFGAHHQVVGACGHRIEHEAAVLIGMRGLHRHSLHLHGHRGRDGVQARVHPAFDAHAVVRQHRDDGDHRLEVVAPRVAALDHGLAGVEVEHHVDDPAGRDVDVRIELQAALLRAGRVERDLLAGAGQDHGVRRGAGPIIAGQHEPQLRVLAGRQLRLAELVEHAVGEREQVHAMRGVQYHLRPAAVGILRGGALVHADLLDRDVDFVVSA